LENSWKTAAVPQYPPFRNARLYLTKNSAQCYQTDFSSDFSGWERD